VRAATLAGALDAAGLRPDAFARVDGILTDDGETPLVGGDVVACDERFPPR
jgi:hypothetical protein